MKKLLVVLMLITLASCSSTLSEKELGEFIKSPFLEDLDGMTAIYEVGAEEYEDGMIFEYEGLFYFLNTNGEKFPPPNTSYGNVGFILKHEKNSIVEIKDIVYNNKQIRIAVLEMGYGFLFTE